MHSFRIHADGTVTWTPKWTNTQVLPKQKPCEGTSDSKASTSLTRAEKSRARKQQFYALHEKVTNFRASAVLRWWARDARRNIRQRPPPSTTSLDPRAPGDGLLDAAPCAAVHAVGASPSRAPPEKIARGEMGARVFRAPAGRAAVPTERVAGAQEAQTMCMPMCVHSPGGGATTDPRTPPCETQPCGIPRGSHGVLSGGMDISSPPHSAPHVRMAPMMNNDMPMNAPYMSHAPDIQQAYAQFMSFHMHQGLAHEQAYHMWVGYAQRTYGVTYST